MREGEKKGGRKTAGALREVRKQTSEQCSTALPPGGEDCAPATEMCRVVFTEACGL